MNIKNMVRDGKQVSFIHYNGFDEKFIYKTECGFEFPVPVDDAKGAIFLPQDKAMLFMRYIRKHIKYLESEPTATDLSVNWPSRDFSKEKGK